MSQTSPVSDSMPAWEQEIRTLEDEAIAAFMAADLPSLQRLWSERFVVNNPLQQVIEGPQVLQLLTSGRIRHSSYECQIERVTRHGDVVVVMGSDRVTDPPDGTISRRRYTNVWQLQDGTWRTIARQATIVAREVPGKDGEQSAPRP